MSGGKLRLIVKWDQVAWAESMKMGAQAHIA